MNILNDQQLVAALGGQSPIVSGFPPPIEVATKHQPFSRGSAVQPCSIDLHIGEVLVPQRSGKTAKRRNHSLRPGRSAIVVTHERLDVPPDLGGFVLPLGGYPQGMLLTNPGHVDPGYKGRLWFTIVNISRASIALTRERRVATLLLFRLSEAPKGDWQARYGPAIYDQPPDEVVQVTAGDVLLVERRAARVARRYVGLAGIVAALISGVILYIDSQFGAVSDVKATAAVLRRDVDHLQELTPGGDLTRSVVNLQAQVKELQSLLKTQGPATAHPTTPPPTR